MASAPSTSGASVTRVAQWRYGTPAILLHWLLALLIVFMVTLGWAMMTVERTPQGPWWFDLHRSVGLVVAALVVLRLLWRLFHRPAPLPSGLPAWQARLAEVTQWLLYACMAVLPLTGYLGSSYSKAGVRFFGVPLPAWATPDRATAHQLFNIHSALVWVLVALVVVHAAGALKHLLVDRDQVFQRMWF